MEINVLGNGVMASQITALLYCNGNSVNIWNHGEVNEEKIKLSIKFIKKNFNIETEGKINIIKNLSDLQNNLTIESIIEDLSIKKNLYNSLKNSITKPYFTNSSSFAPNEIAQNVSGLHFFNPIFMNKLVELCLNIPVSPEIEEIVEQLKKLNFTIVNTNNNRGYIANYIIFNEISAIFKLIELYNYNLEEIKKIYSHLFNQRNIFQIIDIVGVDVTYHILKSLKEKENDIYLPKTLELAIKNNILGKKNKTSIVSMIEKEYGKN